MKKYVIAFGTGRCGTKSLAYLLNNCKNTDVAHEWIKFLKRRNSEETFECLPWEFDLELVNDKINYLKSLKSDLVGDVAFYYLNYINYLQENLKPLKIIYLYRNKKDHLPSQLRITAKNSKRGECCHWLPYNHPEFIKNKYFKSLYDSALPKFPEAKDKIDSINMYWEYYQQKAKELKNLFPDLIFFLKTEEINNHQRQIQLFDFLEIPKKDRVYQSVRK